MATKMSGQILSREMQRRPRPAPSVARGHNGSRFVEHLDDTETGLSDQMTSPQNMRAPTAQEPKTRSPGTRDGALLLHPDLPAPAFKVRGCFSKPLALVHKTVARVRKWKRRRTEDEDRDSWKPTWATRPERQGAEGVEVQGARMEKRLQEEGDEMVWDRNVHAGGLNAAYFDARPDLDKKSAPKCVRVNRDPRLLNDEFSDTDSIISSSQHQLSSRGRPRYSSNTRASTQNHSNVPAMPPFPSPHTHKPFNPPPHLLFLTPTQAQLTRFQSHDPQHPNPNHSPIDQSLFSNFDDSHESPLANPETTWETTGKEVVAWPEMQGEEELQRLEELVFQYGRAVWWPWRLAGRPGLWREGNDDGEGEVRGEGEGVWGAKAREKREESEGWVFELE